MPSGLPESTPPSAWDGLAASLIHDIGKVAEISTVAPIVQAKLGRGETLSHTKHLLMLIEEGYKQFSISGAPQIPELWYDLIKKRASSEDATGTLHRAHKLADRISKHMQGEAYSSAEASLPRGGMPTAFYPYFGVPLTWSPQDADKLFAELCRALSDKPSVKNLLSIQNLLSGFPHSRYVPHLSLQLHDLFTTSLFYFIYRRLRDAEEPENITEFEFFTFEIALDLLDVFYRLRDVLACAKQSKEFYKHVYSELFAPWESDLSGMSPDHNPFVFYSSQGFVFLYPDLRTARLALEKSLRAGTVLRRAEVRCSRFVIEIRERDRPGVVRTESFLESVPAPSLADFAADSGQRCEGCQRIVPVGELKEDDKGSLICEKCRANRREGSGIDLDLVSNAGSGSNRVAYVFVTLPPGLRRHAADVAQTSLIPNFWSQNQLPAALRLPATEQHVYEYLQAVLAIRDFDAALEEGVKVIRAEKGQNAAHVVFQNPSSKAIVVHEDYFWELLDFIHYQKQKLRLECSVRAVICPPKTPFWSLVELATQHQPADILWDVSKGAIHMFSNSEIASIRQLARDAQKYHIWRAQLNALSAVALQTSLEELVLEIDNRSDRLKEMRDPIKNAVRALGSEGSPLKDQEKRAVFFKYIAGLTR